MVTLLDFALNPFRECFSKSEHTDEQYNECNEHYFYGINLFDMFGCLEVPI